MQECRVFLWQCEIDVHVVVDALQAHDESSDFEIGAGLQVGDADAGFEGRDDALALDDDLEALGARRRGGEILARLVELLDREGWTVAQRFTAIEIGAGQACLGFGSGKRSLLLTVIELNKDLAFFDGVARGEATFGDQAGDFIAQLKLLTGDDSADGARCGRPLRFRDADGRNGVARFGP